MRDLLLPLIVGWVGLNLAFAVTLQLRHRWQRRGRYRAPTPWWAWALMPWATLPLWLFVTVDSLLVFWCRRAERRLRNPRSRKP